MGFNSTSHKLTGWEINSTNILFKRLVDKDFELSNSSETNITLPDTDLGFIQSWKITSELSANSKVNFTGVFSMGKSKVFEEAINLMKKSIYLIQTNVTHPEVRDMAIVKSHCNRMGLIDKEFEVESFIINLGNTEITSTEFWTIANFSSGADQITLYSSIFSIENWKPMEILSYSVSWTPNKIGMYTFIFIVGGYMLLLVPDDSILNNYHSRTIFVYNYEKIAPHLGDLLILAPNRFPVSPFIIQHPGDIAFVNITLISPMPLEDLTISISGTQSSMIQLKKSSFTSLDSHTLIQMTIMVPMFFKQGIYLQNLKFN